MSELADRRVQTSSKIQELQERLGDAETKAAGKACVYATGSYGRCEASTYSDLDLFILGKWDKEKGRHLKRLDEICIKADLIEVTRDLRIQEFSGDGRYLVHYTVEDFTKTLGTPEDDVTNTFTARLLLLLESRPLLENSVYQEAIGDVVTAYWRDYEDHKLDFVPAFLANDILRLWRTFCVNYEARTERKPPENKAKGKLKNYKLKHSRLLTCYSALLYLLCIYKQHKTVTPDNAIEMIHSSPTERLEWILQQSEFVGAHRFIHSLLEQYEHFLKNTNASEADLNRIFQDKKTTDEYIRAARQFGDAMFEALTTIGEGNNFHRLLVV